MIAYVAKDDDEKRNPLGQTHSLSSFSMVKSLFFYKYLLPDNPGVL